jgi:predicted DNA-binding protein
MKPNNRQKKEAPVKMLPPVRLTKHQREWLEEESKRTGNTLAVLVRNLIQEQISKEGEK